MSEWRQDTTRPFRFDPLYKFHLTLSTESLLKSLAPFLGGYAPWKSTLDDIHSL